MFAGLSDVMTEQRINWCARCEVFRLHRSAKDCPERWVGPKPESLTCSIDPNEPCPLDTTRNDKTRVCEPKCPPGGFFDAFLGKCVFFE